MVGTGRFELPTCRLGGGRSIHLSYVPVPTILIVASEDGCAKISLREPERSGAVGPSFCPVQDEKPLFRRFVFANFIFLPPGSSRKRRVPNSDPPRDLTQKWRLIIFNCQRTKRSFLFGSIIHRREGDTSREL